MIRRSRLAQIFSINGLYTPTKASVFLRPSLYNQTGYIDLDRDSAIIDATNFSSITRLNSVPLFVEDTAIADFSGVAYIRYLTEDVSSYNDSDFNYINYRVKATTSSSNDMYIRVYSDGEVSFDYELCLDSLDNIIDSGSIAIGNGWNWINLSSFSLWDHDVHNLSLRFFSGNIYLDQIAFNPEELNTVSWQVYSVEGYSVFTSEDWSTFISTGTESLAYADSFYVTVHAHIYKINSSYEPIEPLHIYDYKTTIEELNEVEGAGWYNFDTNFLTPESIIPFDDEHALVLRASGSSYLNFISWDKFQPEPDAYVSNPSASWSL